MITVIEAAKSLNDFIKLPLTLHSRDPFFVPQLNHEMKVHFSPKNPFFDHATVRYFIAMKDGRPVGRIASLVNRVHNDLHGEKTGFFGFFDCINDTAVSERLYEKAAEHLTSEGMSCMRGPMSFSTNEECGMLIEGFQERPMIMMPYNPPYYNELAAEAGLRKVRDLYAYIYDVREKLPEKVLRVAALVEKRGITVRPIIMKQYLSDMMIFKDVYHSAWEKNWGFVPMSDKELEYGAGRLKQIIIPEMTLIAEEAGKPVGFMGMVPDFNFVLKQMKGSLNPVSLAKAFYYSRKIKDLRVMLLGVKKEYRNKGIEALLFREGFKPILKGGYQRVEFSWILEDNLPVQRTIETMEGRLYKKYRIYEKPL
ncbi:MAG: GNAT family N-acetyltransferase [Nitrospirae bacterium]|nr:MAG: GNAT family N-acetyltransferase [Nitrospirota bacterium]